MIKSLRSLGQFVEKEADKLVWLLICLYISFFSIISWLKYNSFSYGDFDLAVHAQTVWNILHGSIHSSILGIDFPGNHVQLILFLIAPIYAVFRHPLTLLILQTLALGLAAYPLYLLAKEELSRIFGAAIVFIYLFYPALGYTNLFEFHPPVFATVFLLFMFYYFKKGSFWKFCLFMFLSLLCQENISLIILMFGIYAIFAKRKVKWIAVPVALGGIWFWICLTKLMPYFNKQTIQFISIYGQLGNDIFEVFQAILLHPLKTLQIMFTKTKIIYLCQLFIPLGLAPLFNPGTLLPIVPTFMQHLLSSRPTEHTIYYHYTAEMIPFIFISAIYGLKRLSRFKGLKNNQGFLICALLAICLVSNIYLGPHLRAASNLASFKKDYLDERKESFVASLPKDAEVVATFEFLPRLAHRKGLYSFHHLVMGSYTLSGKRYLLPVSAEYALIDFNDPLTFNCFYIPDKGDANIRDFLKAGNWGIVDISETIALLKKDYNSPYSLCKTLAAKPKVSNKLQVTIDRDLQLLGYDSEEVRDENGQRLHLIFYWRCLNAGKTDYGAFVDLTDAGGRTVHRALRPLGYRIYPASSLSEGQMVREDYWLLMPPKAPSGNYQVKMGIFDYQRAKMAEVNSPESNTLDSWGRINLVTVRKE